MIRRIALTLGMGVAIMSLDARTAPSLTATDAVASFLSATGLRAVSQNAPRGPHRSGYIVASS